MSALGLPTLASCLFLAGAERADPRGNFFANSSFELGREHWQVCKAGKTTCHYRVNEKAAADGRHSVLLAIDNVEEWGVQFGQSFPSGEKGRTYTFAVSARSVEGPVEVSLAIERNAKPWDKAVTSERSKLTSEWQELHVTFKVEKDFPQGWFAFLNCVQPKVRIQADMFRLYEGNYLPHEDVARQESPGVAVRLFDTGGHSSSPLAGKAMTRRSGWTEVPEEDVAHAFKGDLVCLNDRIALALRRGARGAEMYSLAPKEPVMRTLLAPVAGAAAARLNALRIVEHNPSSGVVEAAFVTAGGKTLALRYELRMGQPFVQAQAHAGVAGLRVEAPCRFAVLPDFFADDIVIDAADLPVQEAALPSDHLLLHLCPDHQAMVMTVTKTSEEDIRIALSGRGDDRLINGSELHYGEDGKIWVAILSGPGIWHMRKIAGEQADRTIRLDWHAPFPAQWRVDWRRDGGLTDSWEMIVERPDGRFDKHGLFGRPGTIPENRSRWTTVLGRFRYPCWVDPSGRGYLQPLKTPALRFHGPTLIYPLSRVPATALSTFTVVDVVRNTLGVGPCEYVLDVEGQASISKGMATCAVRDTLNTIYAKKQQHRRRDEVQRVLKELMVFIRYIRWRIERYVTFGHDILNYLAEQKKAHPELAEHLAELERLACEIDARAAARKDKIKTPDQAAEMVEAFRRTVLDNHGEDALAKCKRFTGEWVEIGGNQDELAGECRWAVKVLRQRAGLLMACDPRMTGTVTEIRRRSQIVLRNPAGHEGARH